MKGGLPALARRRRMHPDEGGFSLVEVMVAMGIFLVVSAATLGLVMNSLETVRGNADRVYAAALARQEVETLRGLGSAALPLGATDRTVTDGSDTYTVTRTITWVDAGATTNPCEVGAGVVPGRSYLRVRVDVLGGDLEAPQTLDAIVYPTDTAPTQNTGTVSVAVRDDLGEPVAGVTVTGSDGTGGTFQQVTGPDGCLFVPDLKAGPNWVVAISKPGYITEQPNGQTRSGVVVDELQNTALEFDYALKGSITFAAGSGGYPVPAGMPFEFAPDTLDRAPSTFTQFPTTVTGLWPDQYTGWLRPCLPSADGSNATVVLAAGGTAALDLGGTRVQLVGPPEGTVTATYDGGGGSCTASYPLGVWDESLLLKAALPAGTWTFTTTGATPVNRTVLLTSGTGQCSVSWNVPGAIDPNGEPSASPSAPPSPSPSGSSELVLPEVSEPCPQP